MSNRNARRSFLFESLPVRGVLLQLDDEWRKLHGVHDYAPAVRELLGESVVATTLIASTMKFEGMVTLQLAGSGSLGMLVTQCTHQMKVRGMAGELTAGEPAEDFSTLIGDGRCVLTVDTRSAKDRYQGIVDVEGESLADCLTHYYAKSAQLPAHFVLLSDADRAAGLMLQRMPDSNETMTADDWHRLGLMAQTLTLPEMTDGVDTTLLGKLFSEDDVRVFKPRPVEFGCRCSTDRAEQAVRILGQQDAEALIAEQGGRIRITCEFCNRQRTLDRIDVARLFSEAAAPGSGEVH